MRCSTEGSTGVVLSDFRKVDRPGACIVEPGAIAGILGDVYAPSVVLGIWLSEECGVGWRGRVTACALGYCEFLYYGGSRSSPKLAELSSSYAGPVSWSVWAAGKIVASEGGVWLYESSMTWAQASNLDLVARSHSMFVMLHGIMGFQPLDFPIPPIAAHATARRWPSGVSCIPIPSIATLPSPLGGLLGYSATKHASPLA